MKWIQQNSEDLSLLSNAVVCLMTSSQPALSATSLRARATENQCSRSLHVRMRLYSNCASPLPSRAQITIIAVVIHIWCTLAPQTHCHWASLTLKIPHRNMRELIAISWSPSLQPSVRIIQILPGGVPWDLNVAWLSPAVWTGVCDTRSFLSQVKCRCCRPGSIKHYWGRPPNVVHLPDGF